MYKILGFLEFVLAKVNPPGPRFVVVLVGELHVQYMTLHCSYKRTQTRLMKHIQN